MLLHCHSRKCNTTREHKLKLESNEALCMDCGEINNMVSDFMKKAMKAAGDIYRSVKGKKAFMYKCPKCTIDRGVKIVDEQALCETCGYQLNLSAPMIEAIKTTAPKPEKAEKPAPKTVQAAPAAAVSEDVEPADEEKAEPKAELNKGFIKRHKE